MIIKSALKTPPIAAIRTRAPNTVFIASWIPFLKVTYNTTAIIIARNSVDISINANNISLLRDSIHL